MATDRVLVGTSIWVEHLRAGHDLLVELLQEERVLIHPFIIGELACGNLRNRDEILSLLAALPLCAVADTDETLAFISGNRLMGHGLGYVDMHVLEGAILSDAMLLTGDRRLAAVAGELGAGFNG